MGDKEGGDGGPVDAPEASDHEGDGQALCEGQREADPNHHLATWCADERLTFTRSRPENKSDGCFVEQEWLNCEWRSFPRSGAARIQGPQYST